MSDETEREEQSAGAETDEDGNELAPDGSTLDEVEADREERLDPDNRPEGAEIDNTDRTFDEKTGFFTDSEGADEADEQFAEPSEES